MKVCMKDIEVFSIDIKTGFVKIYRKDLVPFGLNIKEFQNIQECINNIRQFDEWCSERILPLSRKYAKKIYNSLGIQQVNTIQSKAKFARSYSCVSIQDCYWVKTDNSKLKWDTVNVINNSLSNALTLVSLTGNSMALKNVKIENTPDISTNGTYAKAWLRNENNIPVLLKPDDSNDSLEVDREISASKILDCFNVKHVKYFEDFEYGIRVSKCECMTNENLSIVDYKTIKKYCYNNNTDPLEYVKSIDSDGYYKMIIATYLIGNVDLHDGNWGLYYDPNTRTPLRIFDLFDFNNAFDEYDYFELDSSMCLPTSKCIDSETGLEITDLDNLDEYLYQYIYTETLLDAAKDAMNKTEFKQIKDLKAEYFISDKYKLAFIQRCKEIDLNVVFK